MGRGCQGQLGVFMAGVIMSQVKNQSTKYIIADLRDLKITCELKNYQKVVNNTSFLNPNGSEMSNKMLLGEIISDLEFLP